MEVELVPDLVEPDALNEAVVVRLSCVDAPQGDITAPNSGCNDRPNNQHWRHHIRPGIEHSRIFKRAQLHAYREDNTKMTNTNCICIKWGTKYGAEYVNRLYAGLRRNLLSDLQFFCMTDDVAGLE